MFFQADRRYLFIHLGGESRTLYCEGEVRLLKETTQNFYLSKRSCGST